MIRLSRYRLAIYPVTAIMFGRKGRSLMREPSERIDRADSPGWLFFVLEISENLALGRPPAQRLPK
jgi:hypothetical protein